MQIYWDKAIMYIYVVHIVLNCYHGKTKQNKISHLQTVAQSIQENLHVLSDDNHIFKKKYLLAMYSNFKTRPT